MQKDQRISVVQQSLPCSLPNKKRVSALAVATTRLWNEDPHRTGRGPVSMSSMFSSPQKPAKRLDAGASPLRSPVLKDVFFPKSDRDRKRGLEEVARTPPRPLASVLGGNEDRFIPNRANFDEEVSHYLLTNDSIPAIPSTPSVKTTPSHQKLRQELSLLSPTEGKRIMDCRQSLTPQFDRASGSSGIFARREPVEVTSPTRPISRLIPTSPKRVLDIPNLVNDYYLNLLHWGSNNILSVALGPTAYLWHASTGQVDSAMTLDDPEAYISSVQWSPKANHLAVGTTLNNVYIFDAQQETVTRELDGHTNRVGSLSWQNNNILSTGGRDSAILNHDLRMRRSVISSYAAHTQEVCGLAWSPDEATLASGGNENMLCLWDARMSSRSPAPANSRLQDITVSTFEPRLKLDNHHTAAVKALAWCPWQRNTLASGGGTADRTIRIWNTASGENIKCVDTGSQVCAIQWSDQFRELVSSHGFSDYQLIVWKYQDMSKVQELRKHTARVLNLAKSPDGRTICSVSSDETLCFWDIFDSAATSGHANSPVRSIGKSPYKPPALSGAGGLTLR